MTIGEKIRERRKELGLSQEQLAEKIGVSRQTISTWEQDRGLPDLSNLARLSKHLGISLETLTTNADSRNINESLPEKTSRLWFLAYFGIILLIPVFICLFAQISPKTILIYYPVLLFGLVTNFYPESMKSICLSQKVSGSLLFLLCLFGYYGSNPYNLSFNWIQEIIVFIVFIGYSKLSSKLFRISEFLTH